MRVLIHKRIEKRDLKKNNYPSLGRELPRVYKLLSIDGKMPGEGPISYLKDEHYSSRIMHAYIALPDMNISKRRGPRIIYYCEEGVCYIIYVGGHKDKLLYNDSSKLVGLILERIRERDEFIEFVLD